MKARLKYFLVVGILTYLVFTILSTLSVHNDLPVDGALTKGFPLKYYMQPGGEIGGVYEGISIYYCALAIDIFLSMLISILIFEVGGGLYRWLKRIFSR